MAIRFRVGTALFAMTVICFVIGMFSRGLHDVRVRQAFLLAVYDRGGFVTTCFESGRLDGSPVGERIPPVPKLELGGNIHVERIYLANDSLAGLSLEPLKRFRKAFFVSVNTRRLRSHQILAISKMPNLRELQMNGADVDDAMVEELSRHADGVEYLALKDTDVSDRAIPHLERMHSLEKIDIRGTNISDAGRDQLRGRFMVLE